MNTIDSNARTEGRYEVNEASIPDKPTSHGLRYTSVAKSKVMTKLAAAPNCATIVPTDSVAQITTTNMFNDDSSLITKVDLDDTAD